MLAYIFYAARTKTRLTETGGHVYIATKLPKPVSSGVECGEVFDKAQQQCKSKLGLHRRMGWAIVQEDSLGTHSTLESRHLGLTVVGTESRIST